MTDRFVYGLFSDDIRREEGGKISLMGCYQGEMLVSPLPGLLPRICALATVVTPFDRPFEKLEFRICKNEQILAEIIVPEEQLSVQSQAEPDNLGEPFSQRVMTAILVISPLFIEAPCLLRLRATTEEGEHKGLPLRIRAAPQPANISKP